MDIAQEGVSKLLKWVTESSPAVLLFADSETSWNLERRKQMREKKTTKNSFFSFDCISQVLTLICWSDPKSLDLRPLRDVNVPVPDSRGGASHEYSSAG